MSENICPILEEIPKQLFQDTSAFCHKILPPPFFASSVIDQSCRRESVVCFCLPLGQTDPGKAHGLRFILYHSDLPDPVLVLRGLTGPVGALHRLTFCLMD